MLESSARFFAPLPGSSPQQGPGGSLYHRPGDRVAVLPTDEHAQAAEFEFKSRLETIMTRHLAHNSICLTRANLNDWTVSEMNRLRQTVQ